MRRTAGIAGCAEWVQIKTELVGLGEGPAGGMRFAKQDSPDNPRVGRGSRAVLLSDVTSGGATPILEKTLAFTEARNRMLAENIANITTPGYRAKQLDVKAFQAALREASAKRAGNGGKFDVPTTREVGRDRAGRLVVKPSEEPVENLLFQDGTNARVERQMALLAENTLMHRTAVDLLQHYYEGVAKAIRGKMR